MAYTALKEMREYNRRRFVEDVGPFEPEGYFDPEGTDLKDAALRFIHDRCQGLKFDLDKQNEFITGNFTGNSIQENQIPYNMEMDINRLCLERELERFIDSGVAKDAYTVYYCFLEIFFGKYGQNKKMTELLSEFETNGSSLLMKHRDHYSHSVYVFALGLAVYDTNQAFRTGFQQFYGLSDDSEAAIFFLEYWGLTSLFHDIGYPFELPFEQVMAYFEVNRDDRGEDSVLIAYKDVRVLTNISDEARERLETICHRNFADTGELFAYYLYQKLGGEYGFTENAMLETLKSKPCNPEKYNYYMDHAWFSANRLFQELTRPSSETGGMTMELNQIHLDALTAILLHNSLYKFTVASGTYKKCSKQMRIEWHPLAYLLMLCDELQCWDRTAYGRNSRTELHPMAARFEFGDGSVRTDAAGSSDKGIKVTYFYDEKEMDKIDQYRIDYAEWARSCGEPKKKPVLKAFSSMWEKENPFLSDIQHIVDTNQIPLTVQIAYRAADRKAKRTYLSSSSFLHLYDFAVALHNRYEEDAARTENYLKKLETNFEKLSLEYQLYNINQAKYFDYILHSIDCFYTDRPVDFEMLESFTPRQTAVMAPLEHGRWVREHHDMGWRCGSLYETCDLPSDLGEAEKKKLRRNYREQLRMHKLAMDGEPNEKQIKNHYDELPVPEQGKDIKPLNKMLELIRLYDGLRIYRLG